MNISPKYVIVNKNDEIVDKRKDLKSARELVKGTGNRIYNLETKSYERLTDGLDKQSLKNEVIEIADTLEKMGGHLMEPSCEDSETGMLRAKVYSAMSKLHDELKSIIYHIH